MKKPNIGSISAHKHNGDHSEGIHGFTLEGKLDDSGIPSELVISGLRQEFKERVTNDLQRILPALIQAINYPDTASNTLFNSTEYQYSLKTVMDDGEPRDLWKEQYNERLARARLDKKLAYEKSPKGQIEALKKIVEEQQVTIDELTSLIEEYTRD